MFLYRVRYKHKTPTLGPRYVVQSPSGRRVVVPYDFNAPNAPVAAAKEAAKRWNRPFVIHNIYAFSLTETFIITDDTPF